MVEKTNGGVLKISGRIDSTNAAQFEKELLDAAAGRDAGITLDAAELLYVSSAGLRVLLKLKKSAAAEVAVINTSPEVYDIFDVTGFTSLLKVSKRQREISVDGCEIIGRGGNGTVYRLDDDKIVKVYRPVVSLDKIEREREFAKTALINGVPCVIAYDVVKCGDSYGIVFEMLRSDTLGHAMKNNPEKLDEYVEEYVALAKELHSAKIETGTFTNIKTILHERVPKLAKWCTPEEMQLLDSLIDELPDGDSIIHGDLHPGNIMIQDGELVLIDMPEVTMGAKLWDIAGIYRDLISAPQGSPDDIELSVGMPSDMIIDVGHRFFRAYTGMNDEELEVYFKQLGLVYALNVVLIVGAGSKNATAKADAIMDNLLRKVVIPNEQALRYILRS